MGFKEQGVVSLWTVLGLVVIKVSLLSVLTACDSAYKETDENPGEIRGTQNIRTFNVT